MRNSHRLLKGLVCHRRRLRRPITDKNISGASEPFTASSHRMNKITGSTPQQLYDKLPCANESFRLIGNMYEWDSKEAICRQLYVDENKSLDEVMAVLKDDGFAPRFVFLHLPPPLKWHAQLLVGGSGSWQCAVSIFALLCIWLSVMQLRRPIVAIAHHHPQPQIYATAVLICYSDLT